MSFLEFLSGTLGWTYTFAWSISFYPQFILNLQRRSVRGLSIDFLTLNVLGFACYTTANLSFLLSENVRREYGLRHGGGTPSVRWNDVAFSAHALAISLATWAQSRIFRRDANQRLSPFNRTAILAILGLIFVAAVTTTISELGSKSGAAFPSFKAYPQRGDTLTIQWLDLVNLLSSIKVYISFAKYLPQAWVNYGRKSTRGWSIGNILCDFTGGVLSLGQLVLDAAMAGDWSSAVANPGKLGISLLSIIFDLLFMVQHYILYRHSRSGLFLDRVDQDEDDFPPDPNITNLARDGSDGESRRLLRED